MRRAHRLAVLTAAATCVLIVFGGLVTSTGAALAVPDWPTTFGHNMFLFPWSQMVGGVFYEHSHRLLGSLVGLLTLALAAVLVAPRRTPADAAASWRWSRSSPRASSVACGVVLLTDGLAMVHGPLAQAFFALIVALALITSERMGRPVAGAGRRDPRSHAGGRAARLPARSSSARSSPTPAGSTCTCRRARRCSRSSRSSPRGCAAPATPWLRPGARTLADPPGRASSLLRRRRYLARLLRHLDSRWAADDLALPVAPSPGRRPDPRRRASSWPCGCWPARGRRRRPRCAPARARSRAMNRPARSSTPPCPERARRVAARSRRAHQAAASS